MILLGIFFAYLTALVLYFLSFELQHEALYRPARRLVCLTLTAHGALLLLHALRPGYAVNSLVETIGIVSFLMIAVSFVIEWRAKTRFLMLFSLPIVLLFSLLSVLLNQADAPLRAREPGWLWLHTGLILSGFTFFILSVSSALMYLLQSRSLKSKHLGNVFLKLPPLPALDRLHFVSLSAGVILFSLGIVTGFIWATELREVGQILKDPKVTLSFLTCVMYWVVLSLRLSALKRGQKIAMGTVFIFIFLFVTLMSSVYSPSGFHRGF